VEDAFTRNGVRWSLSTVPALAVPPSPVTAAGQKSWSLQGGIRPTTQCTRVVAVVGRTVVVVRGRVVVVGRGAVVEVVDVLVVGAEVVVAGSWVSTRPKFPHPPRATASRIAPSRACGTIIRKK
jgi:ABC-type Fe3+-hydroxamate transport system substrate-binding protein